MDKDTFLAKNKSHTRLTIDIDGLGRSIVFRSGGQLQDPTNVIAQAAGGTSYEGLYEPWTLEGEVTVNKDLAAFLLSAYNKRPSAQQTSAIVETYSDIQNTTIKYTFNNVTVMQAAQLNIDGIGGEVVMHVAFSLNDLVNREVL